jgi:TRIAD3 protein (E3 ubiquitin-protein ligase RNF216)
VQELNWVRRRRDQIRSKEDQLLAEKLNAEIAEEEGGLIECGCCCDETPFENIVQCSEGHLFCKQCLQRYAEQTVFGDGRSQLKCMNSSGEGCVGFFPDSMLRSCLPEKVLEKFNEAQARDAVKAADLSLITCHECKLQVIIDDLDTSYISHLP